MSRADPFLLQHLPRYLRRSKSIEELIPWLYLKGVSTGDFQEALQAHYWEATLPAYRPAPFRG